MGLVFKERGLRMLLLRFGLILGMVFFLGCGGGEKGSSLSLPELEGAAVQALEESSRSPGIPPELIGPPIQTDCWKLHCINLVKVTPDCHWHNVCPGDPNYGVIIADFR